MTRSVWISLAAKNSMRPYLRRTTPRRPSVRAPEPTRRTRRAVCALRGWVGDITARTIAATLARLGRYRALNDAERADARLVFGDGLDLDAVRIAQPGPLHRLLFALQRMLQGGAGARAFVTGSLVHAPPGRRLERALLIHELTHVWQARVYGPRCMWQALHAQFIGAGYDYSGLPPVQRPPACDALGEGAEHALCRRAFADFNREQQAQILMHYFVRRFQLGQSPEQCAPWEAHAQAVRAGAVKAATRTPRARA